MKYITKSSLKRIKRGKKKGDNGRVLVIGGSDDYQGAVVLAGLSALRSGVDWVTIATLEKLGWNINSMSLDLVVKKLKGKKFTIKHAQELLLFEKRFDVVLIGNGLMINPRFVKKFVKNSKKPLVIDADAIKVVSIMDVNNSILTPHKKELELLMRNSKCKDLKSLQKKLRNNVLVIKGRIDKIITKNKIFYNKTGNPGMTKAGTGDVLAGLISGFYGQTKDLLESAKLGTYYNGLIGDILLKKKKGYSYLASDMVKEISKIL